MRFAAIYSGTNAGNARLIAIARSPKALRAVAGEALRELARSADPATERLETGRRQALEEIIRDDSNR
jgi:hypothetical protein